MHVALVTDRAYLPWCATAISSCAEASVGRPLDVHVLHAADVGHHDGARLRDVGDAYGARVHLCAVDEADLMALPSKCPALGGRMSWVRVRLAELLPALDRVVYLDADTFVVESIAPLWDLDLEGAPVAAVPNVTEPAMRPHLAALGIDEPAGYFNAGVLVIDLAQWRASAAGPKLVEAATARGEPLPWYDQDALNIVFAGRYKRLHARWNAMNSLWVWAAYAEEILGEDEVREAKAGPAILHFEGPSVSKPWHFMSDHPWTGNYRATLARTPWRDTPLDDRTLATRLIALLPPSQRRPAYIQLHRVRSRIATGGSGSINGSVKPLIFARRVAGRVRDRLEPAAAAPAAASAPDGLSDDERAIKDRVQPYTMTSAARIVSVLDAVEYVVRRDLPGSFVECGVWRGGSVLAMVLTLQRLGVDDREIFLFDTFEGMTPPSDADTSEFEEPATSRWERDTAEGKRPWEWAFGSHVFGYEQVRELLLGTGYPEHRLHFVKGPVEETIPGAAPDAIALLRLDTDWYESTRHELVHLYPRLATGGVLIIDDYGHWQGARRAVDEYFASEAPRPLFSRVDYTGRMAVKW